MKINLSTTDERQDYLMRLIKNYQCFEEVMLQMDNLTNEELEWIAYLAGDYLIKNDYINLSIESARNVISNIRFKAQQAILENKKMSNDEKFTEEELRCIALLSDKMMNENRDSGNISAQHFWKNLGKKTEKILDKNKTR